jgi:hypothetical protein
MPKRPFRTVVMTADQGGVSGAVSEPDGQFGRSWARALDNLFIGKEMVSSQPGTHSRRLALASGGSKAWSDVPSYSVIAVKREEAAGGIPLWSF